MARAPLHFFCLRYVMTPFFPSRAQRIKIYNGISITLLLILGRCLRAFFQCQRGELNVSWLPRGWCCQFITKAFVTFWLIKFHSTLRTPLLLPPPIQAYPLLPLHIYYDLFSKWFSDIYFQINTSKSPLPFISRMNKKVLNHFKRFLKRRKLLGWTLLAKKLKFRKDRIIERMTCKHVLASPVPQFLRLCNSLGSLRMTRGFLGWIILLKFGKRCSWIWSHLPKFSFIRVKFHKFIENLNFASKFLITA